MQNEMDLKDKELQQTKQRNQYLETGLNECRTQIINSISMSNIKNIPCFEKIFPIGWKCFRKLKILLLN